MLPSWRSAPTGWRRKRPGNGNPSYGDAQGIYGDQRQGRQVRAVPADRRRRFDADRLSAFPPGSVIVLPGNTPHFHWAKSGEYVTQVTAIGPLGLDYLDPTEDPRRR